MVCVQQQYRNRQHVKPSQMKSFLEYIADDMLAKYGSNLSRLAVVFPNKRASLFLNEYLARKTEQPLWSPHYITISELFRNYSQRLVADPIKLVSDLHKTFTECTGIDETLDHFYGWGQLLLSDFDDVDKNMAPADRVFANLRDIHELDDISYLSQEQKDILRHFFSNFNEEHNTELKRRFIQLWSHIGDIYHAFNQRLADQGLAYEGALYREVAELQDIEFEYETYICRLQPPAEGRTGPLPPHEARGQGPILLGFRRLLSRQERGRPLHRPVSQRLPQRARQYRQGHLSQFRQTEGHHLHRGTH